MNRRTGRQHLHSLGEGQSSSSDTAEGLKLCQHICVALADADWAKVTHWTQMSGKIKSSCSLSDLLENKVSFSYDFEPEPYQFLRYVTVFICPTFVFKTSYF